MKSVSNSIVGIVFILLLEVKSNLFLLIAFKGTLLDGLHERKCMFSPLSHNINVAKLFFLSSLWWLGHLLRMWHFWGLIYLHLGKCIWIDMVLLLSFCDHITVIEPTICLDYSSLSQERVEIYHVIYARISIDTGLYHIISLATFLRHIRRVV